MHEKLQSVSYNVNLSPRSKLVVSLFNDGGKFIIKEKIGAKNITETFLHGHPQNRLKRTKTSRHQKCHFHSSQPKSKNEP